MADKYNKKAEKTWDAIAKSFDLTRRKPWQPCIDYIKRLPKSATVADIGCGNGRHLIFCAQHCKKAIGIDISSQLLKIVENKIKKQDIKNVQLYHTDVTNLPLKDRSVDAVLYIAAIHNVQGRKNRIQSLQEIRRILKKDKSALISVWSREQDKFRQHFLKESFTQKGESEFGDIDIYWRQHGLNIPRFYHLYSKNEFQEDLVRSGFKIQELQELKMHSIDHPDNFFAIVDK
jgi:ubiquinone/menaquinone biosynthesis C-methylase UbiE